jgi:hypothetical protein
MKKLMEHSEVLVLILLSLLVFCLCSLMIYDNINTQKINEGLKDELYEAKKEIQELREKNSELDWKLNYDE